MRRFLDAPSGVESSIAARLRWCPRMPWVAITFVRLPFIALAIDRMSEGRSGNARGGQFPEGLVNGVSSQAELALGCQDCQFAVSVCIRSDWNDAGDGEIAVLDHDIRPGTDF